MAHADPHRSVSHSEWLITADQVTLKVFVPADEMKALVGKSYALLSTENVAKYVLSKVSVAVDGAACPAIDQGYDIGKINSLSASASLYAFELIFRCNTAGGIVLTNTLLQEAHSEHIDYARIGRAGDFVPQMFTASQPSIAVSGMSAPKAAHPLQYASAGASHIFHSYAGILMLLALCMLVRNGQWALSGATMLFGYMLSTFLGFSRLMPIGAAAEATLGFLLLLSLALLLRPSMRSQALVGAIAALGWALLMVGALIHAGPANTVLLVGLGALAAGVLRGAAAGGGWPFLIPFALFGVLDGLIPAEDFVRLQHIDELAGWPVLGFNVGSFLASVLLLAAFATFLMLAKRNTVGRSGLIEGAATTSFAGFGAYWLLSALI